jgi:hypothetical protein
MQILYFVARSADRHMLAPQPDGMKRRFLRSADEDGSLTSMLSAEPRVT